MELRSQPHRHPVLLLMDPVLWLSFSTEPLVSFKTSTSIPQSTEGAEKCIVLISGIIWMLPGKGLLKALRDWCESGRNQSKWAEQSQPPLALSPECSASPSSVSLGSMSGVLFTPVMLPASSGGLMWCEFLPLGWTEKFTESQKKRAGEAYKGLFVKPESYRHKQGTGPSRWLASKLPESRAHRLSGGLFLCFVPGGGSQLLPLGLLKSIPFVPHPPQRLFCWILIVCLWVGHPSFRKYLPPQHLPSLPFSFTVTRSVRWCFWIGGDEAELVIHSFKN